MKLFFPNQEKVLELLESIAENYPGSITYRDAIEVEATDPVTAAFLKRVAERYPVEAGKKKLLRDLPAELTCKSCGKQFEPVDLRQKFCPVCREERIARKNGAAVAIE